MNDEANRMGKLIDNFLLMFVGLKLAGFITWSWWWVMSPLWGAFALGVALALPGAWRKANQRKKWRAMKEAKAVRDGQHEQE